MTDQFSRRQLMALLAGLGFAGIAPAALAAPKPKPIPDAAPSVPVVPGNLRLAVVLPSKDDPFYKTCLDGVQEAAAAIGAVDVLVGAPEKGGAREQIAIVNGFVKQKVDAIIIAPIEAIALGPACRRAVARGIEVVSFDKPLPVGTRLAHVDGTGASARATTFMTMLAGGLKDGGDVAILAGGRPGPDGQGLVSDTMQQWLKPAYGKLKLAETVFGNEDEKAGYAAAEKLMADRPSLKGILVFNEAAFVGAAQCLQDKAMAGKVFMTGFGRPSALKKAMEAQVVERFASVNPVDLGYGTAEIAIALAKKDMTANVGSMVTAGRLGQITLGEGNVATLPPFVIDEKNFAKFADVY